jgi:hypothetical protein
MPSEAWVAGIANKTLLKRLPKPAEVTNVAVLMALDYANVITSAVANLNCGEMLD